MLEGENIIVRLFEEGDLEQFTRLYNNYSERGEYYPIAFRSLVHCRKRFSENGFWADDEGSMLITDKQGGMLGMIFFFKAAPYHEGYEVGYTLFRQQDRGQGVLSEALPLFCAYLFEWKKTPRLQLLIHKDNAPSRRVAEKCGFKHEGTLRQSFFMRGKYHDCDLFSLLRGESSPR